MTKSFGKTALLLGCLFVLSPALAQSGFLKDQAQQDGAEAPSTQILSDSLTYDDSRKTSRFSGAVVMTRGLLTLKADQLDLREDAEGFQYGSATVAPDKRVYIRQERPENFEVLIGLGDRAEYDGKQETFELIGRARLTRFICGKPLDNISGQRVRYSQKTDTYQAFGGPASDNPQGRVRSVAQPRSKIDAAVQACRELQASGAPIPDVPAIDQQ